MYLAIVIIMDDNSKINEGIDLVSPVKVVEVNTESLFFGESIWGFPFSLSIVIIHGHIYIYLSTQCHTDIQIKVFYWVN